MQFTPSHEWIVCQADIGTIGITLYAQKELGEIVYIELPAVGKQIKKGEEMAVLESTKAAADIYSPVTGLIIEINQELVEDCSKLNRSPEKEGWICKIQMEDLSEVNALISSEEYQILIG
ncbi:MAG: glycine cleavage system protein GcvH [Chlamydiae bacterium]|nr:glycine cleavage system protein GcvH [Chlamydiota bacterium]